MYRLDLSRTIVKSYWRNRAIGGIVVPDDMMYVSKKLWDFRDHRL